MRFLSPRLLFCFFAAMAVADDLPKPPLLSRDGASLQPLFVIERNNNANVVHYDARLTSSGTLDPNEPVEAYWIMNAENGRRQELNLLERTKGYGFVTRRNGVPDSFKLTIVSDRKHEIEISRQGSGVRAIAVIGGHRAYLQRIYVTTRKTMLLNVPQYAEMFGTDVDTGEPRYEKVLAGL